MLTRLGTPVASAVAAFALAIALSGAAVGVALVADTTPLDDENAPAIVDTHSTFEDVDGNGIDDDCQTEAAVADPAAEASAAAAIDLDKDGTISTSEAAKSDRVGGKHCNHGGYVSGVAKADGDDEDAEADEGDTKAECETSTEPTEDEDAEAPHDEDTEAEAPNAHGKAVSEVAKSDAVGGKHCNHGGAVSEAAKGNKPDKAEKAAERAAAKAEREAAKAARQHGNGHGNGGGEDDD